MQSIIHRAQMGDIAAFQQLVETYYTVAWRTARVLQPDIASIEDILQESWIDAWRGLPRFQNHRPFRPWLLALVTNRCRMAARRARLPTITLDDVDTDLLLTDDMLKHLLLQEQNAELRAALALLPAEQQRVLELRFFADLELAEIALVTGIPLGTVKSRLHRGLHTMRTNQQASQIRTTCINQ